MFTMCFALIEIFHIINRTGGGGLLLIVNKKLNACLFDVHSLCPALTNLSHIDLVGVKIKLNDRCLFNITLYIPLNVIF